MRAIWLPAQDRETSDIRPTGSFTLSGGNLPYWGERGSAGLNVNDIRAGFRVGIGNGWDAEMILGFTGGQLSFKEMFLRYSFPDGCSRIQAGHFVEPFGLEYIESPPFNRFNSFSSPTQAFSAKRSVGVQYSRWSSYLWGTAGIFSDGTLMNGAKAGPQGYALTGRFILNPLRSDGSIAHTGLAATWRRADGNGEGERTISYSSNGESAADRTAYVSISVPSAYAQRKVVWETILSFGRFCFSGEYYRAMVDRTDGQETYNAGGAYAQAGILLTGDRMYRYDLSKARLAMCNAGTWELMARWSVLNLNDTDAGLLGGRMTGVTLGLNGYLASFLRLRLSIGRQSTDASSLVGKGSAYNANVQIMLMFN